MRKISANYVYPVTSAPLKNGILIVDDEDRIVELIDTKGQLKEQANLEFYNGILVPGFVDVFTLLSYSTFSIDNFVACLQGNFLLQVQKQISKINSDCNSVQRGINQLETFGTKLVADFFPETDKFNRKQKSKIYYCDINSQSCLPSFKSVEQNDKQEDLMLVNRHVLSAVPNLTMAKEKSVEYCIGTGSLQTHAKLSVFEELKFIQKKYPNVLIWELINWATYSGAKYLGLANQFGSLECGKAPGLNLITKLDFQNQRLTDESEVKVLI